MCKNICKQLSKWKSPETFTENDVDELIFVKLIGENGFVHGKLLEDFAVERLYSGYVYPVGRIEKWMYSRDYKEALNALENEF